jgi:hypothetical protein
MIRLTASVLRRSGAQFLAGERWVGEEPGKLAAAVADLTSSALERYASEIGKGGGELVLRIADRRFECLDQPADRAAPIAPAPRPVVATNEGAPTPKFSKARF